MNVGKRIRELREEKNYTINKLAKIAKISQSYLRDVELENKNPTVSFISQICDALNISLQDFFNDNFDVKNDPLINGIYKLTSEQRNALTIFLQTLSH